MCSHLNKWSKDMNAVTFLKLLKANNPFVVKGALFPPSIWDHLFR